jgi:hypothetical protein
MLLAAAGLVLAACQSRGPVVMVGPNADRVTRYGCSDGDALSAAFYPDGQVVVSRGGGFSVKLPRREAETGLWYADEWYELRGPGPEITFGKVGEDALVCRAVG